MDIRFVSNSAKSLFQKKKKKIWWFTGRKVSTAVEGKSTFLKSNFTGTSNAMQLTDADAVVSSLHLTL